MSAVELRPSGDRTASPRLAHADAPAGVLFDRPDARIGAQHAGAPPFFVDLNLDQVIDAVTADWSEYDLKPFFNCPLNRVDAIRHRHEVFQDLQNPTIFEHARSFAQQMRDVRVYLALSKKLYYQFHKEGWFVHAVEIYCEAVNQFAANLASSPIKARGLIEFRDYLTSYTCAPNFVSLLEDAKTLRVELANVSYCALIHDSSFTVLAYESQADYSSIIEETFDKFKQGAAKDYKVKYRVAPEDMNHIEAKILEFVARLHPELFARLLDYCAHHVEFVDETIATFDREIHFYVAYLEYIARFEHAGLRFCYPKVSRTSKELHSCDGFDLALAQKLIKENGSIVCNDFSLRGDERTIVVSGPNQGGKTTFARMFGQLHYLACLGCPVPGREAQLFLFDQLFTHFEREEKVESLRGKLEDDLTRAHAILERATSRSVVVMNEIFTSTTIQDEIFLSKKVMEKIAALDLLCVWVTFVDELASFNSHTVSMISTIVPENPALRTFKIMRRPADGLAYAMAIAEKYRLAYERIKERMKS